MQLLQWDYEGEDGPSVVLKPSFCVRGWERTLPALDEKGQQLETRQCRGEPE